GCVMQVGPQSINVARNAVLSAGWPESVPGTTVDRQCGSSQQAMHFAAQGVIAGAYDVVIAAGVEVMSQVPMGASIVKGMEFPFSKEHQERYKDTGLPPQGIGADMIADEWKISREDLDAFGALSQQRAEAARDSGRFANEIVPVTVVDPDGNEIVVKDDEGIRPGTTAEILSGLKPAFQENGRITAGNSSQISDGASAVLIISAEKAKELGLKPRARFHSFAVAGSDPVKMLDGPIPATEKLLKKTGLSIADIDRFEVNEAFASVVLAWQKKFDVDIEKVNANGGAIALGHPLGASGTKLMATLLNELERSEGKYGLQVMCEGGGMANATLIERI
ncbi:MAG: thiolase family protein, partial [Candidatus Binatia bacterium]|nr:thiolase family protein [Candidatus Binatia bacterium]